MDTLGLRFLEPLGRPGLRFCSESCCGGLCADFGSLMKMKLVPETEICATCLALEKHCGPDRRL